MPRDSEPVAESARRWIEIRRAECLESAELLVRMLQPGASDIEHVDAWYSIAAKARHIERRASAIYTGRGAIGG